MIILFKVSTQQMWAVVNPSSVDTVTEYVTLVGTNRQGRLISTRIKNVYSFIYPDDGVMGKIRKKIADGFAIVSPTDPGHQMWRERIERHLMWKELGGKNSYDHTA